MKEPKYIRHIVVCCPAKEKEYAVGPTYAERLEAVYHARNLQNETGIKHRTHIVKCY